MAKKISSSDRKRRGRPRKTLGNFFGAYIERHRLDTQLVARRLHKTRSYVLMLASGEASPGSGLMWDIECWTRGAIPMQAWFDGTKARLDSPPEKGCERPPEEVAAGASAA